MDATNKPHTNQEIPLQEVTDLSGNETIQAQETQEAFPVPLITRRAERDTAARARLGTKTLQLDLLKKGAEQAIVQGLEEEVDEDIKEYLDKIFRNPGEYSLRYMAQAAHKIERDWLLERSIERRKHVLESEIVSKPKKDALFNLPILDNATIVWLDLHLTFSPQDTVQDALARLQKQYRGKFNAVILLDEKGYVQGLIHAQDLEKADPKQTLAAMPLHSTGPFPTIDTPRKDAEALMGEVNILPVVDSRDILHGVLTKEAVTRQETRFYTARLDTEIRIDKLHHQVEGVEGESA